MLDNILDDMFSFIDPVIDQNENDLSEFIVQLETFFDYMEKEGKPVKLQRPLTEEDYKEMWVLRYQQYLGQITFREMLDKWKEIVGISSPEASA